MYINHPCPPGVMDMGLLQALREGEAYHRAIIEALGGLDIFEEPYSEMVRLHNVRGTSFLALGNVSLARKDFQTVILYAVPDRRAGSSAAENRLLQTETVKACGNLAEVCLQQGDAYRAGCCLQNMVAYMREKGQAVPDAVHLLKTADKRPDDALALYHDTLSVLRNQDIHKS
jgi:hypothetical protein